MAVKLKWQDVLNEFGHSELQRLKGYAYVLCGSNEEAEDLVHDALVKLFGASRTPPEPLARSAYLRRTILNLYLDRNRRTARFRGLRRELVPSNELFDFTPGVLANRDIGEALRTLSPRQRACLVARFMNEMSIAETASALGCAEGTVKRHISDALARLRPLLTDYAKGGSDDRR